MISREVIRRYPFFAGFNQGQIDTLSLAAELVSVERGYCFFREGEEMNSFYLLVDGLVGINIDVTDKDVNQPLSGQLTGNLISRGITVSAVQPGQIFGWSALIPPHESTAGAKAIETSRVIEFDCEVLRPTFVEDCCFGHLLTQKAAQVVRERLRDMRIVSLAEFAV